METTVKNISEIMEHHDNVSIPPNQLTADIMSYIKQTLKDKVENRCNRVGYILSVEEIISISDGILPPENFNGNIIFHVTYTANTCMPKENNIVIAKVQLAQHILCSIGPLWIYVGNNLSNKVKKDDLIKIKLTKIIINANDQTIKALGEIIDVVESISET